MVIGCDQRLRCCRAGTPSNALFSATFSNNRHVGTSFDGVLLLAVSKTIRVPFSSSLGVLGRCVKRYN
jgi:hypothetical protein